MATVAEKGVKKVLKKKSVSSPTTTKSPPKIVKKKRPSFKEYYEKWREKILSEIKDNLLSAYDEENFEIIDKGSKGTSSFFNSIDANTTESFSAVLSKLRKGTGRYEGSNTGRLSTVVLIRFPKLDVRNSKGKCHTIHDMFIRIQFDPYFRAFTENGGTLFEGRRTTYSSEELYSNYTFSHLPRSSNPVRWNGFCLGSTPFQALCLDLVTDFNINNFGIFCHQLKDYLCWESLEGGPYTKIGEIIKNPFGSAQVIRPSTSTCLDIQKQFLKKKDLEIETEVISTPLVDILSLVVNDKFLEDLKSVITNPDNLQYWDEIKKVYIPKTTFSSSDKNAYMQDMKRRYCRSGDGLLFKGENYMLKFSDELSQTESEDRGMREVPHQDIVKFIESRINERLIQQCLRK